MLKTLSYAAVAAALSFAAPAMAQDSPSSEAPAASASGDADAGPSASGPAPSAEASAADVNVTAGMTVKDKTGASIGEITDVNSDGGKTMATIKMGADTFAVDTSTLAVQDGAATINATQAEIQQLLQK